LALLILALGIGGWRYARQWGPSKNTYPEQGIDVSHYQGRIDWPLLPAQGVRFAYIKASEGEQYRDSRFLENWRGAGSAGIARGAYHYFSFCRPGAAQAVNFIAAVPAGQPMLPPVVDVEMGGNCAKLPSKAALIGQLTIFIRAVEAHFGQPVTLYMTRECDEAYGLSARFPRRLWLRRLVLEPSWSRRPWSIWQASNFRHLNGISGRVDWNVMRP
jgi:lysozyme